MQRYYELTNLLDGEETNLRYVIRDEKAGILETNSSMKDPSELEGLEKYFSYDSETHNRYTYSKDESGILAA